MSQSHAESADHPPLSPTTHVCDVCGYDLRNDPFGRCPECGLTSQSRHARVLERNQREVQWMFTIIGWLAILTIVLPAIHALIEASK